MAQARIAVIGAGKIGGTLGRKWVAAGHQVTFGVVDPQSEKAAALRSELGGNATIGSAAEALDVGDVVVLAVPGGAMDALIRGQAARLDSKIVVDAANQMGGGPMNSQAALREAAPHAQIYRAFNSLGWENFADPMFGGVQADLFFAGPDGASRETVEQLIAEIGLHPVYVGGPDQFAVVDSVASLWFALALGQRRGRHLAFKMLTP